MKKEGKLIIINNKNNLKMSKARELRRKYEKPSMKVVLLKQRTMLLAGSFTGERDGSPYGEPIDY